MPIIHIWLRSTSLECILSLGEISYLADKAAVGPIGLEHTLDNHTRKCQSLKRLECRRLQCSHAAAEAERLNVIKYPTFCPDQLGSVSLAAGSAQAAAELLGEKSLFAVENHPETVSHKKFRKKFSAQGSSLRRASRRGEPKDLEKV